MRNRTLATLLATSLLFSGCTYSRYTGTTYPLPVIPPEQKLDRPVQVRSSWEKHMQSDQDPWYDYAKSQIEKSRLYIAPMVSEQAHPAAPPLYLELESKSYNNDPGVLTILNGVISGMTLFVIPWRMSFKGGAIMTVSDDHRVLYRAETVGKHVTTIWIGPVGLNDPSPATMMDAYSVHSKAIADQMQKEYQLFIQAQAGGTAESYQRFLQQANWYRYAALRELAGLGMGMRDATAFYDGLMARYNDVASVLPADYLLLARGPANTRLRDLIQRSKRGESAGNLAVSVTRTGADYGDFSDDQLRQLVQRGMPVSVLDSVISTTQRTRQYQRQQAEAREAIAQAQRQQELQEEREARARQQEEDANRHAVIMGAFADVQQNFNQMGTDLEASRAQNQAVLNEYHAARQRDLEYAAAAQADQSRREREERAAQQSYNQNQAIASAQLARALNASSAQSQHEADIRAYHDAQAATAAQRSQSSQLAPTGQTRTTTAAAPALSNWPEGITVCKPAPAASRADDLHCIGPFSIGVIESLDSRVRLACGSASDRGDGIREYASSGALRIFGCGFGINPEKANTNTWHADQVQRNGLGSVPGRRSYRCPSAQLDPCFTR